MNLVTNAIKFSQAGDVVNIKCKLVSSEIDLSVNHAKFANILKQNKSKVYLEVQVQDSGIGINKED